MGRHREHATDADRQRAYRARRTAELRRLRDRVTDLTTRLARLEKSRRRRSAPAARD